MRWAAFVLVFVVVVVGSNDHHNFQSRVTWVGSSSYCLSVMLIAMLTHENDSLSFVSMAEQLYSIGIRNAKIFEIFGWDSKYN